MAVGSTLAYVTPHLNGAIDIMAVRQPDGTIKTSPFYGAGLVHLHGHVQHRHDEAFMTAVRFLQRADAALQCALASIRGRGCRTAPSKSS
jgi:hypothetical protein